MDGTGDIHRCMLFSDDLSIAYTYHTIGSLSDIGIMRDEDDSTSLIV
jgi:hypothetical protein